MYLINIPLPSYSPSSSQLASVSRWDEHSRTVVFHTLYRGQRDTRLCPLISWFWYVVLSLPLSHSRSLYIPHCHYSPPSSSSTAAAVFRAPTRSISSFYHHRILTRIPGALPYPSHRSNSDCVAIYCAAVFWRRLTYSSIVKNPAASLTAAAKVYLHVLSVVLHGICPVSCLTIWVWNPPKVLPMRGVTTQVSAPKISTAWTTALKNNPDTQGVAPYLLRMREILLQTFFSRAKFLTTAGQ